MNWFLDFNKLLKVFGFLGFYFVGLGWFIVFLDVALFFAGNLHYIGQSFLGKVKNWGSIPSQAHSCFYFVLFTHDLTCSTC